MDSTFPNSRKVTNITNIYVYRQTATILSFYHAGHASFRGADRLHLLQYIRTYVHVPCNGELVLLDLFRTPPTPPWNLLLFLVMSHTFQALSWVSRAGVGTRRSDRRSTSDHNPVCGSDMACKAALSVADAIMEGSSGNPKMLQVKDSDERLFGTASTEGGGVAGAGTWYSMQF